VRELLLQTNLAKIDPNKLGFINIPLLCLEKRIDIFFLLGIKSSGDSGNKKVGGHCGAKEKVGGQHE